MKTTCDLCLQPQPLLWPGEKNLCPDCFRDVKDVDDADLAEMFDEGRIAKRTARGGGLLADLYAQLSDAETACGEAEDDINTARNALKDAEEDCRTIEAKIAAIKKVGQRRDMAVFA